MEGPFISCIYQGRLHHRGVECDIMVTTMRRSKGTLMLIEIIGCPAPLSGKAFTTLAFGLSDTKSSDDDEFFMLHVILGLV